jgi:MFS family permease
VSENHRKYLTLFSLYIAQSVPMSFFTTVIPVLMRQENYSLELIGLVQLIKLPWAIKFLWAPLVDKAGGSPGNYRKIIFRSEMFYAIIILLIGFFNMESNLSLILFLMVIAIAASATQDIATDAFAIKTLSTEERGLGNSMQSAGGFFGALLGSGVLLIVYNYFGWRYLFMGLALFVAAALIPLYFYRTAHERPEEKTAKAIKMNDLLLFFTQKGITRRILLLLLYYSGIVGIMAMLKPWLIDMGLSVSQIGFASGIFGTAMGAIFAFIGGILIRKIGRKRSIRAFAFGNGFAALSFCVISLGTVTITGIYIVIGLIWISYSMSTVVIYTISMDIVRKGREGTDFTIQIVITQLGSLVMAVLSGKFAGFFSYTHLFFASLIMAVINIIAVRFLYHDPPQKT